MIRKNEATAAKRQVTLYIFESDGVTPAPAATSFTTGGGGNTQVRVGTSYSDAAGTMTNTGVDGEWVYQFTQAETNVTACELAVKVVKATFLINIVTVELLDPADVNSVNVTQWLGSAPTALGANGGIPLVGTQIPNAAANAVGGLAVITAIGQGPGGMEKPNSKIDNCVYSSSKLTSSRLRVFASSGALASAVAGHSDNADGEVERYVSAATYNMDGTLATFNWTKQL